MCGRFLGAISGSTYFGEIALLADTRRIASVRAATTCDLLMIDRVRLAPLQNRESIVACESAIGPRIAG